jgi:ParB-like chromosome segregation protein Spo0J
MPVIMLPPADLEELPGNENVMSPELYASLKRWISERGFKQAVLVRPLGPNRYGLVDGLHRKTIAIELGLEQIPCEVDASIKTDEDARLARIAMNRHRGELNLTLVGASLADLADAGWTPDEICLSGFTAEEAEALIDAASEVSDLDAVPAPPPAPEEPQEAKREWPLELVFASAEDLQRARKFLKEMAGKGGSLAQGLIEVMNAHEAT